jgi:restriction endonuclease S subunit
MAEFKTKKIIKDIACEDSIILRADKSMEDMMKIKPSSRWSPDFWHPSYDYLDELLNRLKAKTILEIEGREAIIAGDHVRPSRGESKGFNLGTGIEYYETKNFLETGYDYSQIKECSHNAYERLKETAVQQFDILISNAGVGGVGKARSCIITHNPSKKSCTGDVFAIRLKRINPIYFYLFLKSKMGKDQIYKIKNGVSTENISSQETLSIRVPLIEEPIQEQLVKEYKNLTKYHDKAMDAKKKGDAEGFKKNIEVAEKMLKDLIARIEAVIRGERDDVI